MSQVASLVPDAVGPCTESSFPVTPPCSPSRSSKRASIVHSTAISDSASVSSFMHSRSRRVSRTSSSGWSHPGSPSGSPRKNLRSLADAAYRQPLLGHSSPIDIPGQGGVSPVQSRTSSPQDDGSNLGKHCASRGQFSSHRGSPLRDSLISEDIQSNTKFSSHNLSHGQPSSRCAYAQSPGGDYYDNRQPQSGSPSYLTNQSWSPSPTAFPSPSRASPASQATHNLPGTPPLVIMNTVNNFFSGPPFPAPSPQTEEGWLEGQSRQRATAASNLQHHHQDDELHTEQGSYLRCSAPASDAYSERDNAYSHTTSHSRSQSPAPYIPSSFTMPSFGSVLEMGNADDSVHQDRLWRDMWEGNVYKDGDPHSQEKHNPVQIQGRQRSASTVTVASSASSYQSCISNSPRREVQKDTAVPEKCSTFHGRQDCTSVPHVPSQAGVLSGERVPSVQWSPPGNSHDRSSPRSSLLSPPSQGQLHSHGRLHPAGLPGVGGPTTKSTFPEARRPQYGLIPTGAEAQPTTVVPCTSRSSSSAKKAPVFSTVHETHSGLPSVSRAPKNSPVLESKLLSPVPSSDPSSYMVSEWNALEGKLSRVFSRRSKKDKEGQDSTKTTKCGEKRFSRRKADIVSFCGELAPSREQQGRDGFSAGVSHKNQPASAMPQDRCGFLGRFFHRECVEQEEKVQVRADIAKVVASTVPAGKIDSILGTVGETNRNVIIPIIKDCLETSSDVLQLVPVPCLTMAVRLLLDIWDACEQVGENQLLCIRLTRRCTTMIFCIHREIVEAGKAVEAELSEPLTQLCDTLERVCKFLHGLTGKSALTRFFARRKFSQDIKACEDEISDTLARFNMSTHVRILKWELSDKWNPCSDAKACLSYVTGQEVSPPPSTTCIQCRISPLHCSSNRAEEMSTDEPIPVSPVVDSEPRANDPSPSETQPLDQILEIWAVQDAQAEALDRESARIQLQNILSIQDESELTSRLEVAPEELPKTVAALEQELQDIEAEDENES